MPRQRKMKQRKIERRKITQKQVMPNPPERERGGLLRKRKREAKRKSFGNDDYETRIVLIEPFTNQDQLHEEEALKVTLLKELNQQNRKIEPRTLGPRRRIVKRNVKQERTVMINHAIDIVTIEENVTETVTEIDEAIVIEIVNVNVREKKRVSVTRTKLNPQKKNETVRKRLKPMKASPTKLRQQLLDEKSINPCF